MRIISSILLTLMLTTASYAQQNLKPGETAPDFSAQSLDGKTYSMNELQGKVVMLTFWSTRCAICQAEIPKLNQVADRYKDKDVVFLALTMENQARIEPFLKRNPFNFNILPNGFGIFLKYANMDKNGNINMGFPSYFLINKKGYIALRAEGWDKSNNIDSQISRMLSTE